MSLAIISPLSHTVPLGAIVCEMKICELCGVSFVRPRSATVPKIVGTRCRQRKIENLGSIFGESLILVDTGVRFCSTCDGVRRVPTAEAITVRIAELDAEQTKLKEQMPGTESQMDHRSLHMVKFDRSLAGNNTRSHQVDKAAKPKRGAYVASRTWLPQLLEANKKEPMLMERIADFVPNCYTPHDAYLRLYALVRHGKVRLTTVGRGERRIARGPAPLLYRVEALCASV